jgi:Lrp/AsnC family transcriptional regulator for asnA, asnC and gidA
MAYELDPLDRQIISILQQDGRASNVEIARRLGVSEATVRKRLDRLLAERVVRVTAVPDAAKIGLSTVTFINLDVDLSRLDQIADDLSQLPEVRALYYTSGESDLIIEAWFPSGDELLHFLTRQAASIPGVRRAATSHVLRTLKDSSTWVLPSPTPPRILLVDDDPDFVAITQMTLTSAGLEVVPASSGKEALALMRMNTPDLVILDVMMRGVLDGVQTAREMRSDSTLQNVPILMVSSITDSAFAGLLPKGEALPADNFLAKPIDSSLLVAEAKRLLRSKVT